MSQEDSGADFDGFDMESLQLGQQERSANVITQLETIRDRGQPATRFHGLSIMDADAHDIDFEELSGGDAEQMAQRRMALGTARTALSEILSGHGEQANTEALFDYLAERRRMWKKILKTHRDDPRAEELPEVQEARDNLAVYDAIATDITGVLQEQGVQPQEEGQRPTERESRTELPTLKELLKVKKIPDYEFNPKIADDELKRIRKSEIDPPRLEDVAAYYYGHVADFAEWKRAAAEQSPKWAKYQEAVKAVRVFFTESDRGSLLTEEVPVTITLQADGAIDVRPVGDPPVEAQEGSEQFIIDSKKDQQVLNICREIDKYEYLTEQAREGIQHLQEDPPQPITEIQEQCLARLSTDHRISWLIRGKMGRLANDLPTLRKISEVLSYAKQRAGVIGNFEGRDVGQPLLYGREDDSQEPLVADGTADTTEPREGQEVPERDELEEPLTHVEQVLQKLRQEGKGQGERATLPDGVSLIEALKADIEIRQPDNLRLQAGLSQTIEFIERIAKIHAEATGTDPGMEISRGIDDYLIYPQLTSVLGLFRKQRRDILQRIVQEGRYYPTGREDSRIYTGVIGSIHEAAPYTPEAQLPTTPEFVPIPPDDYLGDLQEALREKRPFTFADFEGLFTRLGEEIPRTKQQIEADVPRWKEQKAVMEQIEDEIERLKDAGAGSLPLLLVAARGEEATITPYQVDPQSGIALQEEMHTDDGSRRFIFNPNSQVDKDYMTGIFNLDRFAAFAPEAAAGIKILADNEREQAQTIYTTPPEITSAQFEGMIFMHALFVEGLKQGNIDREAYGELIGSMSGFLSEIRRRAIIKEVESPFKRKRD